MATSSEICRNQALLDDLNTHNIAILKIVMLSKADIRSNFHDCSRMASLSRFVLVSSQDHSPSTEDRTAHNGHANCSPVRFSLKANAVLWKIVFMLQLDIERSWKEIHSRFSFVMVLQSSNPRSKIPDACYDNALKNNDLTFSPDWEEGQ